MNVHLVILLLSLFVPITCQSDKCAAYTLKNTFVRNASTPSSSARQLQYLLYDVQNGEGFNLRRDVYMRMATVVYYLNNRHNLNVTLVLPSWGPLAHWKPCKSNSRLPWSTFFHVQSLASIVPVLELNDFLVQQNSHIDLVISLSYFDDSLDDEDDLDDLKGKPFNPHYSMDKKCSHSFDHEYYTNEAGKVSGWFWSFEESVTADELICCYFEGTASTMAQLLSHSFISHKSIMISDSQIILHDAYGSQLFWRIRKSITFSSQLIDLAQKFIELSFTSASAYNKVPPSTEEAIHRSKRYRYMAVHLRRSDFTQHRKDVPTLSCVAEQILTCITQNSKGHLEGVTHVFLASDGNVEEIQHLTLLLEQSGITVVTYKNDTMSDGEVAIIDQIICSRAFYFVGKKCFLSSPLFSFSLSLSSLPLIIEFSPASFHIICSELLKVTFFFSSPLATGTFGSTFSFRIQEEREILSFPPESTFNCLCASCVNMQSLCKQESQLRLIQ